jgi:hypothetical protein
VAHPGLIEIVYREPNATAVVNATIRAYGLHCSGYTEARSADMKTVLSRATDCDVEKGQETYWLKVPRAPNM